MKKAILNIIAIFLLLTILMQIHYVRSKEIEKNIFYVGKNAPGNYSYIQDAIDNASNGDTIFVYNGTYRENIIVNKTLNIFGENKETTIISGDVNQTENGPLIVFYIPTDQANISGFTITNNILEYDAANNSIFGVGILITGNNTTI